MENVSNGPGSENNLEKEKALDETKEIQPKEAFVYRQDVVRLKTNENTRGLVMEVAGEYDSDGSISDDTDNEEDEHNSGKGVENGSGNGDNAGDKDNVGSHDSLPDNKVRVTWTDGSETTEDIDSIAVVDRGFLHGDIVASALDPTGQLGLVVDVNVTVDLHAANGEVVRGVSTRDLRRITEFNVGDYVVSGPWLGRVDEVLDNVTVLFDDGAVCKVGKADPLRLKPIKPLLDDASCPYYPGQHVRAVSSSVYKTSRWLNGMWKASRLEGTVTKVETVSVIVYWIASAYFGTNQAFVPPEEQNPKNLVLLSWLSYANWQLADWCFLPQPVSSCADNTSIEGTEMKEPCSDEHTENNGACSESSELTDAPESGLDAQNEGAQATNTVGLGDPNVQSGCHHVSGDPSENTTMNAEFDANSNSTKRESVANGSNRSGGDRKGETKVQPECPCSSPSAVSKDPAHENLASYRKKLRKVFFKRDKRMRRKDEIFERPLFIANTMTKVDVAWQDGTKEYGISATSLIPIQSPNDHEFFPEQYVVDKVSNEVDDSSHIKRMGIVRSVNAKDRTVSVSWLKPVLQPDEPKEFESNEVVSAYELDGHPDYDYCYADVVVRLPSVSHPAESTNSKITTERPNKHVDSAETEASPSSMLADGGKEDQTSQNGSSVSFESLSWVGIVTGFHDGDIEVMWGDGVTSKVGPHEIYVVGREDGDSLDDGTDDDGASWETVDENEMDLLDDSGKESDSQNQTGNSVEKENSTVNSQEENSAAQSGPLSVALGFVTRLASELFARGKKSLDVSTSDAMDETESQESHEVSEKEYEESSDLDVDEAIEQHNHVATAKGAAMDTIDSLEISSSMGKSVGMDGPDSTDDSCCFKHFDIVQSPSDHHFLDSTSQGTGGRKWVKKVQQEWSILEKNLPDDVYVRVFEDRMDLMRAVIVGASGTPYQDGLFVFDFHLPPEYPQVPPSAFYHSFGLRVNPNLYVDGKVCLSLLNTWTGKGNEVWDPSSSSILQVLVSLQGLVLNAKPYFNEAGYEKQVGTVEGEKNSLPYNENTYLLSLKSMLFLLRRPPMHFEDFAKDHFRRRGHYVLKACEAYLQGSLIGSLTEDACTTERSTEHCCSVGFKLALQKILPRLISALKDVGANCEQFEHLQKSESMQEC